MSPQTSASILKAIDRLDERLGLFPLVTGGGKVGDGGGGLEFRFSFKLAREGAETVELLYEVEEMERLVFRRSRILNSVCISSRRVAFQCYRLVWALGRIARL